MQFILKRGAPAALLLAMASAALAQERPITFDARPTRTVSLGELEISGFAVGSASWNSHLQLVPEFAGGAQALAAPRQLNFRFDKVGLALSKRFGPTLSVSAAFEIESHADRHSHLRTNPATQCVGVPVPCETFGAETPTTESTLDKLALTWLPWGGGGGDYPFLRPRRSPGSARAFRGAAERGFVRSAFFGASWSFHRGMMRCTPRTRFTAWRK